MSLQSDNIGKASTGAQLNEWKYLEKFIVSRHTVSLSYLSYLSNCCSSILFSAEAPECSSELWRWQESDAGGWLSAPGPAGVSTQLCGRCYNRQLPNSASFLYDRVGKLCEEYCSKVYTNPCFTVEKHLRVCFGNLLVKVKIFRTL